MKKRRQTDICHLKLTFCSHGVKIFVKAASKILGKLFSQGFISVADCRHLGQLNPAVGLCMGSSHESSPYHCYFNHVYSLLCKPLPEADLPLPICGGCYLCCLKLQRIQ